MYTEYFGIEETPFSITPDPRYLYMSKMHEEALAHLLYGVGETGGFVLLTGEVGTGKTTICRALIDRLPDSVDLALILNPRMSEVELLASICDEMGVEYPKGTYTIKTLVDILNRHCLHVHARRRRAVLIIDEAQNLSPEVLEQVRLLTNLETDKTKLLQIILIGQPELNDLLARKEMRQLAQRITARYHLTPLGKDEVGRYIRHRLEVAGMRADIFSNRAVTEIFRLSGGIPRLINSLCDRCLLGAYAENMAVIDRRMVRRAAAEVMGRPDDQRGRRDGPAKKTFAVLFGTAVAAAAAVALSVHDPLRLDLAPRFAAWKELAAVVLGYRPPPILDAAPTPTTDAGRSPGSESLAIREATAAPVASDSAPPTPPETPAETVTAAAEPQPATVFLPEEAGPGASATAPIPPPEGPSASAGKPADSAVLDNLFAAPSGEMEPALKALFALWRQDYQKLPGADPCARALRAGLACLQGKGTWWGLRTVNRPALVTLENPGGRRLYAVVTAITGDAVTLDVAGREIVTPMAPLLETWTGEYLTLWNPPAVWKREMQIGMRGNDIIWLRRRIGEVLGRPVGGAEADLYDEPLKAAVAAFQRSHGLKDDGIAGVRTVIQLEPAERAATVPLLRTAER